jgi:hypothetical protein
LIKMSKHKHKLKVCPNPECRRIYLDLNRRWVRRGDENTHHPHGSGHITHSLYDALIESHVHTYMPCSDACHGVYAGQQSSVSEERPSELGELEEAAG